jgi:protein-L-isoaspartate O-methyltransferase
MAAAIAGPPSRWQDAMGSVPRHLLVPRWWSPASGAGGWELRDGPSDEAAWLDAAYDPAVTMVTRVGQFHADQAEPGTAGHGRATSSSTMPRLVLAMYRHARLFDAADVLDVGTGSGYGTALLTWRLGDQQVTSIDIDSYLANAATCRLADIGLHPMILTADATGDLPGTFDRIVPMVSLPAIPSSWLAALRPGGRLVFSLTGGPVLITAGKTADGGAAGQVETYPAAFMAARHGPDSPPLSGMPEPAVRGDGDHVSTSPYPVVDPAWGWELNALLAVTTPGLDYRTSTDPASGITTTWITHPDGSWARAAGHPGQPATIHQSGPRRLWDTLDAIRAGWLDTGWLPLRGAQATIDPDGTCHLTHGTWHATIPAQDSP